MTVVVAVAVAVVVEGSPIVIATLPLGHFAYDAAGCDCAGAYYMVSSLYERGAHVHR